MLDSRWLVYILKYENNIPYYVGYGKEPRPRKSKERLIRQKIIDESARRTTITEYIYCDSEQEAIDEENRQILKFGRIDIGTGILVNKTNGKGSLGIGRRSALQTQRSKENLGWAQKEENRKLLSEKMKRNTYGKLRKGYKMPEEQKKKISISHRRRYLVVLILKYLVTKRSENVPDSRVS